MIGLAVVHESEGSVRAPRWLGDDGARRAALIVGGVVFVCGAILVATQSLPLAVLPLAVYVAGVLLWRVPLRHAVLAYVLVEQTSYILSRTLPDRDVIFWRSPLEPVYRFLFMNLDTLTGIGVLRFAGCQLLYVVFLGVMALRAVTGARVDRVGRQRYAWVMLAAAMVLLVCIVWLEVLGIARGGANVRQSLWQFQVLLAIPLLTVIFLYALRSPRDMHTFAIALTIAASAKIAIGLGYFFQARTVGYEVESITSHHDSVLFVTVAFYWLSRWVHHRTLGGFATFLAIGGWMTVGLAANNRRTAFVGLVGALFLLYLLLDARVRRRINVRLLWVLPFVPIYLYAGRNRGGFLFKPAALVMSIKRQADVSAQSRDVENFNLTQAIKHNQLVGTGWGYEYPELIKAPDISHLFPQYLFIAHNSVLWLLAIGGITGFTMLMLPVVVSGYLAARSYRFARTPFEKSVASWVLAVIVCFIVQAWGDMGTQGETSALILSLAFATSAKLAHQTGAWPEGIRLFNGRAARQRPILAGARA